VSLRVKFCRFNNRSIDPTAPNQVLAGPRFHLENHEASLVLRQASGRSDGRSFRHRFQMVHFNSRSNGNRSLGQLPLNRLRCRYLHHPDHRRRRKYSRQLWVVVSESPFARDNLLDSGLEAYTRALFLGRARRVGALRRAVNFVAAL